MSDKIKILFLSACPERLRADQELRDITEKIRTAPYGESFEVAAEWAVRTRDVQDILQRQNAQIVHFSGHGSDSRGIFLENEIGKPIPVNARAIRGLFEPLRGTTKVVILNACETRPLAEALRGTIDHVIVTRRPITDRAAIVFATQFYSSLAHAKTVPAAFHSAVTQLCIGETVSEADIPDLVSREGADPGPLVRPAEVKNQQEQAPPQGGSRTTTMQGVQSEGVFIVKTGDGGSIAANYKKG